MDDDDNVNEKKSSKSKKSTTQQQSIDRSDSTIDNLLTASSTTNTESPEITPSHNLNQFTPLITV